MRPCGWLRVAPSLNLRKPPSSFERFSLALDGRLFVGTTQLQLLEQAVLRQLILQNLQCLVDIIVENLDFQK